MFGTDSKPSRHIAKTVQAGLTTPVKAVSKSMEHNSMTPSSTVSILSDDSSVVLRSIGRPATEPMSTPVIPSLTC